MLYTYKAEKKIGRPRKREVISREEQAVVHDFINGEITATQAANALGVSPSNFRQLLSYVLQHWINTGLLEYSKEINNIEDFEE